jgi:2-oxoisovalerate dehydrogenase E1 component alpha subunit
LRYRSAKEVQSFEEMSDPLSRLQNFMQKHGQMTASDFTEIQDDEKMAVIDAMRQAERKQRPPLEDVFEDAYYEIPQSLKDRERQLREHLAKYPSQY